MLEGIFYGYTLVSTDDNVLGSDERIKIALSSNKLLGTIFGNIYIIILGIDVWKKLVSLYGSFDGYKYGKLEVLFIVGSLVSIDDKVLSYDEGIIIGPTDGEVIDTILGNVDGITLGLNIGTELGPFYRYFDGSNDSNLEGFFLGGSLGSTDGKLIGYDEVI